MGAVYFVDARGAECTCPDRQTRRVDACKHMLAARLLLVERGEPAPSTARVMRGAAEPARRSVAFECPARGCSEPSEVAGALCCGCAAKKARRAAGLCGA